MPGRPARTPAFRGIIAERPAEALRLINGAEGFALAGPERASLNREAIGRLAQKAEINPDPVAALREINQARRDQAAFEPGVRRSLEVLSVAGERRLLDTGLTEVRQLVEREDWAQATTRADSWRESLKGVEQQGTSAEFQRNEADARQALGQVAEVGRQVSALTRVKVGLDALAENRLAEGTGSLRGVTATDLPATLRGPVEGLQALGEVRQAAEPWKKAPDGAALREQVNKALKALEEVPGFETRLRGEILQDLAVKAFLEGHPDAYRELMPADGSPEHAALLLRDLKALATGTGKVETWSGEKAVPSAPGKGPASPRGPPAGLEPLIPEGARAGWTPPVRESARADLPALEKTGELGNTLLERVKETVSNERQPLNTRAEQAKSQLRSLQERVQAPERAEREKRTEVEGLLKRKLRPIEAVQLRTMLADKRTPEEMAKAFVSNAAADDDEAFLAEVEGLLEQELNPAERELALQLRRPGRNAAEVARILRP
jgi:hypothetical protein